MKNEIVIYNHESSSERIEVRVDEENETFWLTQAQIARLFSRDRTVISKHLKQIFNQKELDENEYQPIRYGLTKNIEKPNAINLIFYEWNAILKDISRKDISFSQKLKYIFGKPGYSHDGSRLTSEELRIQEQQATV